MRNQKNCTRLLASLFQAIIDALMLCLSFLIAIGLWLHGKAPLTLTPEVITFFTGTMLAVFYSNSLYSFKTWLLWDEIRAILKSSVLILLVIVLYLYQNAQEDSHFYKNCAKLS